MACLTTDKGGNRRTITLGSIDNLTAESIRGYVERLANAKRFGQPVDHDATAWLARIGDTLHGRLAGAGLTAAIAPQTPAGNAQTATQKAMYAGIPTQHLVASIGSGRKVTVVFEPESRILPVSADECGQVQSEGWAIQTAN